MAGGLFSAIWTDLFQIHVALVGFIASAGYVLYTRGFSNLLAAVPVEKLDTTGLLSIGGGALTNWAGLVSLALGNAMALDFMERVFAADSPNTAKRGCYYAGVLTIVIGACATILGLAAIPTIPTIGDTRMVLPTFATNHLPFWMGMMVFLGVLGASMSTANGAILVISVVLARNIVQRWTPRNFTDRELLNLSRFMAIPTALAAGLLAWWKPEPGILLVVAFDIVFAGCVVPLFLGVYWKKATSLSAIMAVVAGTTCRAIAYFVTPPTWAGLDTLLPPVVSLAAFYITAKLTAKGSEAEANTGVLAAEGAN
ncbi:MAG: hypothetical protein JNK87_08640 [Bryobacterales bacterium]|nr:hypothetical protein [Bryobacterales bacterium]